MRINTTPDIAGNEQAVDELRAGLASAVAVAVAESGLHERNHVPSRDQWLEHDVVAQATAEAAPKVAEMLESVIAERLARRRLYASTHVTPPQAWRHRRRHAG